MLDLAAEDFLLCHCVHRTFEVVFSRMFSGSLFYRIEKERQQLKGRRLPVTSCWKKDVQPLYNQLKEE